KYGGPLFRIQIALAQVAPVRCPGNRGAQRCRRESGLSSLDWRELFTKLGMTCSSSRAAQTARDLTSIVGILKLVCFIQECRRGPSLALGMTDRLLRGTD